MAFNSTLLMDDLWQLSDGAGNCASLVVGKDKALLFDTMIGSGDLKGFVKTMTDLPLTVINSHGHFDHMGGNFQFETVYLHPADNGIVESILAKIPLREENSGIELANCRKSLSMTENRKELLPGTVFDLGGIHGTVLHLPGHTAGSIGLLLEEKRILLAGDACTPQMCLFMDGAQELIVYQNTLERLKFEPFDYFVLGHYTNLFSKSWLDKFEACTELVGKKRGFDFVYSKIPDYTGIMYISETYNKEANGPVGIIVKPKERDRART